MSITKLVLLSNLKRLVVGCRCVHMLSERLKVVSQHILSPNMSGGSSVIPITSHVLDTSSGLPASNLRVSLFKQGPGNEGWLLVNKGITNSDGRLPGLTSPGSISSGVHMMRFETGEYFSAKRTSTFYPHVEVVFNIEDASQHYHIPLLLSPYGYSTYRGS